MAESNGDVEALADWILEHANEAFPWPGELDQLMADDLARAVLGSEWFRGREVAWRANAANGWDMGYTDGIVAAARFIHPDDPGQRLKVVIFAQRPDNPYADETEETFMEAFAKLVQENTELRQQIEEQADGA